MTWKISHSPATPAPLPSPLFSQNTAYTHEQNTVDKKEYERKWISGLEIQLFSAVEVSVIKKKKRKKGGHMPLDQHEGEARRWADNDACLESISEFQ